MDKGVTTTRCPRSLSSPGNPPSNGGRRALVAVDLDHEMSHSLTTRYTFACPARGETTVRLSTFREVDPDPTLPPPFEGVDLPFHNDAEIGVVQHIFTSDTTQTLDEFCTHLYSSDFDARRLQLECRALPWLDAREPPYPRKPV